VDYPLNWITSHLAVGHAPMSYAELDSLRDQGINAIVNLCGEYSDLHQIEEKAGFEVLFLPVEDEHAPEMAAMDEALAWLDEAVYLGKRVLVHCRHGIGRTGTFVTAYLLRRGFTMKQAARMLKPTRANPSNFPQWWLLRKFGKKEGRLTLREPQAANRTHDDLEPFFRRYERLLTVIEEAGGGESSPAGCASGGQDDCDGCRGQVELELIEALYLHARANVALSNERRKELIERTTINGQALPGMETLAGNQEVRYDGPACPLRQDDVCLLHRFRPVGCRLRDIELAPKAKETLEDGLKLLSREVFAAVFGRETAVAPPRVQLPDAVTGRFIQNYFQYLATSRKPGTTP